MLGEEFACFCSEDGPCPRARRPGSGNSSLSLSWSLSVMVSSGFVATFNGDETRGVDDLSDWVREITRCKGLKGRLGGVPGEEDMGEW